MFDRRMCLGRRRVGGCAAGKVGVVSRVMVRAGKLCSSSRKAYDAGTV